MWTGLRRQKEQMLVAPCCNTVRQRNLRSKHRNYFYPDSLKTRFYDCFCFWQIVGKKGGTIQFLDGYIKIPEGALQDTREFLFMMLYGREHSKVLHYPLFDTFIIILHSNLYKRGLFYIQTPGVQVLTPTVGCVPSHNFRKEITVALPMCYFLDSPLPITVGRSTYFTPYIA